LDPLREALDIYLSVRAMPSVERVASEIGHLGGREVRGRRGKPRHGLSSLTATEVRVAELVATGVSNTEIAQRMSLSRRTVAAYVANILSKLRLHSRTELIQLARRARPTR
jgi:DNA-binding NarL/FixJ family response regulator